MLTDPLLRRHLAAGRLCEWEPLPGVPIRAVRSLLLTPDAFTEIYRNPWPREPDDRSDADARERRRNLHAVMGKFASGDRMVPDYDVRVLEPRSPTFKDLLEFRSGPPRPQSRLLAFVYTPGVWIGMCIKLRSELGSRGDPRWEAAARDAQAAWQQLFPGRKPHRAAHPCNSFAKLKALCDD